MQIKWNEFCGNYANITILSNNDSGLFAVQYGEQEDVQTPEIKYMRNDDPNPNSFIVDMLMTVPAPRDVLRTLIVVKSSANCYRVTYADRQGCAQFVAKTYDEIHSQLGALWRR